MDSATLLDVLPTIVRAHSARQQDAPLHRIQLLDDVCASCPLPCAKRRRAARTWCFRSPLARIKEERRISREGRTVQDWKTRWNWCRLVLPALRSSCSDHTPPASSKRDLQTAINNHRNTPKTDNFGAYTHAEVDTNPLRKSRARAVSMSQRNDEQKVRGMRHPLPAETC